MKSRRRPAVIEALESRRLLSATLTLGGAQSIQPGTPVTLDPAPPVPSHQAEMLTAIDPKNPLNIAAISYVLDGSGPSGDTSYVRVWASTDGGVTRTAQDFQGVDPGIAYGADGSLFISYIGSDANGYDVVDVRESMDQGQTFSAPYQLSLTPPGLQGREIVTRPDKDFIAAGPVAGDPGQEALYVTYDDLNGPSDAYVRAAGWLVGQSGLSNPVDVAVPGSVDGQFSNIVVGTTGQLYVSWQNASNASGPYLHFNRAAGSLWDPSNPFDATAVTIPINQQFLNNNPIAYPVPVAPDRGICNAPSLGLDPSTGELYLAYADAAVPGQNWPVDPSTRINLITCASPDAPGGAVWSAPSVIDATGGSPLIRCLPALSVDPTSGSVNVLYYTTGATNRDTAVTPQLATSADHGQTWRTQDLNGSLPASDMNAYDNNLPPGMNGDDYLEYNGLSVFDGTTVAAWSSVSPDGKNVWAYTNSASLGNSGNVLHVTGSNPIIISLDPADPAYLRVVDNAIGSQLEYEGLLGSVGQIVVSGVPYVIIDDASGNPIPAGGLSYDGAGGTGALYVGTHGDNDVTNIAAGSFSFLGSPVTYQLPMRLLEFDVDAGNFSPPNDLGTAPNPPVNIVIGNGSVGASVHFSSTQHLALLNVQGQEASATLAPTPTADTQTLYLGALAISSGDTLDLGNNQLMLSYTPGSDPIAQIRSWLVSGCNNPTGAVDGAWNGTGIDSSAAAGNANKSTALGYAHSADGIVQGLPSNSIEIKYTLYGDANLDGTVNTTDFAILDAYYARSGMGWDHGDFNYDGTVNFTDFTSLGANFNKSIS